MVNTLDSIQLNVALLRRMVPNLTVAARAVGLRPATVSNLCTGKIPVGRAEVRTLVALAELAGCTLDELIIRDNAEEIIETGIKVIDLFAPIVSGGTVGFIARHGMGQLVVLSELMHRLCSKGFFTVSWFESEDDPNLNDIISRADAICHTMDEVFECISSQDGNVFLVADRETILSGELLAIQDKLRHINQVTMTVALVDTQGEAIDEDSPFGPLETLLRFDMDLSVRELHPAVDPVLSTSVLHEDFALNTLHLKIQQQARKLLRRYRELRSVVNIRGLAGIAEKDVAIYYTGERLEAFMTQPFYVAEPYTNRPGVWVPLQDSIKSVQLVLDGEIKHDRIEELIYIGSLV